MLTQLPCPSGFTTWLQVARCYQKACRILSTRLRPLQLTLAQLDVLANLYAKGPGGMTQQELAHRLLVTKGNVSGLLERLVKRGLVLRKRGQTDHRLKIVSLTKKGEELALQAVKIQREFVCELLEALDEKRQALLADSMTLVEQKLDELQSLAKPDDGGPTRAS